MSKKFLISTDKYIVGSVMLLACNPTIILYGILNPFEILGHIKWKSGKKTHFLGFHYVFQHANVSKHMDKNMENIHNLDKSTIQNVHSSTDLQKTLTNPHKINVFQLKIRFFK